MKRVAKKITQTSKVNETNTKQTKKKHCKGETRRRSNKTTRRTTIAIAVAGVREKKSQRKTTTNRRTRQIKEIQADEEQDEHK